MVGHTWVVNVEQIPKFAKINLETMQYAIMDIVVQSLQPVTNATMAEIIWESHVLQHKLVRINMVLILFVLMVFAAQQAQPATNVQMVEHIWV
jgi:hypothetical protein